GIVPAQPAVLDVEAHALFAQPPHPAAQQRRGLQVGGEYAPGRADERLHAEATRPCAQGAGIEAAQPTGDLPVPLAITLRESRLRLSVGEVESALARDQELAADRTFRIEHVDVHAGRARDLGGHQPRRPTADHGKRTHATSPAAWPEAQAHWKL